MYTLHIGNKNYSSWSLRPWMLMRETEIAFDERLTPFDDASGNAAFRGFSPTGKVPCLVDGNTTVWDSLAIAEYLAERHAGVWPRTARRVPGRVVPRRRCIPVSPRCATLPDELRGARAVESAAAGVKADLERLEALWNQGLSASGGPFLAGAPSARWTHFLLRSRSVSRPTS